MSAKPPLGWASPSYSLRCVIQCLGLVEPLADVSGQRRATLSQSCVGMLRGERLERSTAALSQVSTQLEIYRENRGDTTLVNRAVHCVRNSSSPIAKLAGLSLILYTTPPSGGCFKVFFF